MRKGIAGGVALVLFAGGAVWGQDKAPEDLPRRTASAKVTALSPEQFDALAQLIKPCRGEEPWMEIPWLIDLNQARQKAAKEGKPLFVMVGSGGLPIGCT